LEEVRVITYHCDEVAADYYAVAALILRWQKALHFQFHPENGVAITGRKPTYHATVLTV
jgi:hypothetical protein